jgi:hypothetical protein
MLSPLEPNVSTIFVPIKEIRMIEVIRPMWSNYPKEDGRKSKKIHDLVHVKKKLSS